MDHDSIYTNYGLTVENETIAGSAKLFKSGAQSYLSYTATGDEREIDEQYYMALHLYEQGEPGVWLPIMNREQSILTRVSEQSFIVCVQSSPLPAIYEPGKALAIFHYRGRTIQTRMEHSSRMGKWKQMWETRIDQLEKVWRDKLLSKPQNDFEKLFIDSYPYYAGMTENAIQYLVDTELDDDPELIDGGTVCHSRFTPHTWGQQTIGKAPKDWVFDHGARDIAEYVRTHFLEQPNTYHQGVLTFLRQYQAVSPFSTFTAKMAYARLLLPIHFFETIETYYYIQSEGEKTMLEEKLGQYAKQSSLYERMLHDWYEMAGIPNGNSRMTVPEWIQTKRKNI